MHYLYVMTERMLCHSCKVGVPRQSYQNTFNTAACLTASAMLPLDSIAGTHKNF